MARSRLPCLPSSWARPSELSLCFLGGGGGASTRLRNSCGIAGRCLNLNPGNDSFYLQTLCRLGCEAMAPIGFCKQQIHGPLSKKVAEWRWILPCAPCFPLEGPSVGSNGKIRGQQLLFQKLSDPFSYQPLGRHGFRPSRAGWGALRGFGCSGAEEKYPGWVLFWGRCDGGDSLPAWAMKPWVPRVGREEDKGKPRF